MAYEKKDFTGSLFRNDRKERDTHPDYKGDALIDGKEYWINAWLNETKQEPKRKYFSFKFKAKEQKHKSFDDFKDDKPFDDGGDVPFN